MPQIVVEHLSKIYNEGESNEIKALDDVSFSLNKGDFVVILGASGAGKTTLLNVLGGMDHATSGTYQIDDLKVTELNDRDLTKVRRDEIGFVFQFYNLMGNLTAYENVAIAEAVSQGDGTRSSDVLKEVELNERRNNFPSQLSGGEQQRVAIARAIVKTPRLLLCDEPTGALDSKTGASIIKLLRKINHENGTTVIIVTHNANIAQVADRIITIADGKIIEDKINQDVKTPEEIVW